MKNKINKTRNKNTLSQEDIKAGINTFEPTIKPHDALETPDGNNNGAEPAVFKNQRKSHP